MNVGLMGMKSAKRGIIIFSLLLVMFGLWSFSNDDKYFEIVKNIDIYASLYQEVNTYYVDDVNPNTLIETSIDAMLKKLDPYTVYIPEDDIEDYRTNATGQYGGIGILSNNINGKHLILNLYEESPAFNAGLKIGDELIAIDGVSIIDMPDHAVGKLIKGQSGSAISVRVLRNGSKELDFNLNRKKIRIPNISYSTTMYDSIGYFKLNEFTRMAAEDVKKTILDLKEKGAKYLIIDLRGNPGGLLNEAVGICNLFIPKDSLVVETKGKTKAQSFRYPAKNAALDLEIPIVVLINKKSASASEIVSGVIQDYDRGIIVGEKSFGKGLVQATRPLVHSSQLKVTTAKYYIPSGRCIQALDYQHKNEDGTATIIADSLKKQFFTSNGRAVLDGGGVDPDIKVGSDKLSAYTKNLDRSGLIFQYATKYYYDHESIVEPIDFSISDSEYEIFAQWVKKQSFKNTSEIEGVVEQLKRSAIGDKTYKSVVAEVDDISKAIETIKSNGIYTFKEEIKKTLEYEIIKRYYFDEGVLKASLAKDSNILVAKSYLFDRFKYQQVLEK